MSNYKPELELNPTPDNPLVMLTSKIEKLLEREPVRLSLSALLSAALRLETAMVLDRREAAKALESVFKAIASKSEN